MMRVASIQTHPLSKSDGMKSEQLESRYDALIQTVVSNRDSPCSKLCTSPTTSLPEEMDKLIRYIAHTHGRGCKVCFTIRLRRQFEAGTDPRDIRFLLIQCLEFGSAGARRIQEATRKIPSRELEGDYLQAFLCNKDEAGRALTEALGKTLMELYSKTDAMKNSPPSKAAKEDSTPFSQLIDSKAPSPFISSLTRFADIGSFRTDEAASLSKQFNAMKAVYHFVEKNMSASGHTPNKLDHFFEKGSAHTEIHLARMCYWLLLQSAPVKQYKKETEENIRFKFWLKCREELIPKLNAMFLEAGMPLPGQVCHSSIQKYLQCVFSYNELLDKNWRKQLFPDQPVHSTSTSTASQTTKSSDAVSHPSSPSATSSPATVSYRMDTDESVPASSAHSEHESESCSSHSFATSLHSHRAPDLEGVMSSPTFVSSPQSVESEALSQCQPASSHSLRNEVVAIDSDTVRTSHSPISMEIVSSCSIETKVHHLTHSMGVSNPEAFNSGDCAPFEDDTSHVHVNLMVKGAQIGPFSPFTSPLAVMDLNASPTVRQHHDIDKMLGDVDEMDMSNHSMLGNTNLNPSLSNLSQAAEYPAFKELEAIVPLSSTPTAQFPLPSSPLPNGDLVESPARMTLESGASDHNLGNNLRTSEPHRLQFDQEIPTNDTWIYSPISPRPYYVRNFPERDAHTSSPFSASESEHDNICADIPSNHQLNSAIGVEQHTERDPAPDRGFLKRPYSDVAANDLSEQPTQKLRLHSLPSKCFFNTKFPAVTVTVGCIPANNATPLLGNVMPFESDVYDVQVTSHLRTDPKEAQPDLLVVDENAMSNFESAFSPDDPIEIVDSRPSSPFNQPFTYHAQAEEDRLLHNNSPSTILQPFFKPYEQASIPEKHPPATERNLSNHPSLSINSFSPYQTEHSSQSSNLSDMSDFRFRFPFGDVPILEPSSSKFGTMSIE